MCKRDRISELFPNVSNIVIAYKRTYINAIEKIADKEPIIATYNPSFACEFTIACLNIDCTKGDFDLYSEVSSMIAHDEEKREGTMFCEGQEARDHKNSCFSKLEYNITITYNNESQ